MPEVCGRICPQDRLCEGNCVIEQSGHGTVTIGSVEKYINDTAWEQGWVKPISLKHEKDQSVGIIGAGPAGNIVAEKTAEAGLDVLVLDWRQIIGDKLCTGIIGKECLDKFPPREEDIYHKVKSATLISPNNKTYRITK